MDGGADRNRTCDLLIANETLCQLSYDPIQFKNSSLHYGTKKPGCKQKERRLRATGARKLAE